MTGKDKSRWSVTEKKKNGRLKVDYGLNQKTSNRKKIGELNGENETVLKKRQKREKKSSPVTWGILVAANP